MPTLRWHWRDRADTNAIPLVGCAAKSAGGLACSDLTERVYADRPDGGPISGTHCIWVHAHRANKRLNAIGQRIVASGGPSSIYRLEGEST
jgi:hypothetical protein